MFKTQFNNIKSSKFETIELQNRLESGLNISESLADKVLSVNGEIAGGYVEISNGELRYGGRITFNVIYGEQMERIESGTEFSFKKNGDYKDGCNGDVTFSLSSVTLKSNGGMLFAEASVNCKLLIEKCTEVNYLCDIDALKLANDIESYETITKDGAFEVEDEFECQKCGKVLQSRAEAFLSAVVCGDGVIVCDGEVILSLSLLPFNQNNDIIRERRTIPLHYELDCDLATTEMNATALVNVSAIAIKVYLDEESDMCRISSVIGLNFSAKAQKIRMLRSVADAYSDSVELKCFPEQVNALAICGYLSKTEKVSGKFTCEIPENSRFLGVLGERLEIVGTSYFEEKLIVDFIVSCDALFIDGDGLPVSKKAELADSIEIVRDFEIANDVCCKINSVNAKLRSGKIDAEIVLNVGITKCENKCYEVIKGVEEGAEKSANKSAISVYFAKSGDTEWEVSKATGMDIDEIFELNQDLEFPLTGNEKIVVFRKK